MILFRRRKEDFYEWGGSVSASGKTFSMDDVMRFMQKHMRIRDWFDPRAIIDCYTTTFYTFLEQNHIKCKRKNWKFYDKDVVQWWYDEEEPE